MTNKPSEVQSKLPVPYLEASECDFLDHEIDEKAWAKLVRDLGRVRRSMVAMYRRHEYRYIGEGIYQEIDPKCPKAVLKRRIEALHVKPDLDAPSRTEKKRQKAEQEKRDAAQFARMEHVRAEREREKEQLITATRAFLVDWAGDGYSLISFNTLVGYGFSPPWLRAVTDHGTRDCPEQSVGELLGVRSLDLLEALLDKFRIGGAGLQAAAKRLGCSTTPIGSSTRAQLYTQALRSVLEGEIPNWAVTEGK